MKKTLMVALAFVLVIAMSVAGTFAYLTAKTDAVVNTFTVGKVAISLTETGNQEDGSWSAKLIPGTEYDKNPVVSVDKDSEDCYLFVKFEETNNPSDYLTYTSTLTAENGWTKLDSESDVWYRTVKADDTTRSWHLLDGDKVVVKAEVGGSVAMPNADSAPKMTYTAFAVQSEGLTVAQAWAQVKP